MALFCRPQCVYICDDQVEAYVYLLMLIVVCQHTTVSLLG